MRIVFCWKDISGYMAACWKELASRPDVELFVLGYKPESVESDFDTNRIMDGLSYKLLEGPQWGDMGLTQKYLRDFQPDLMFLPGWYSPAYIKLAFAPDLSRTLRIMTLDSPRNSKDIRQTFARLKIGRYLDRLDGVFVCGERSWQLARHLKFSEHEIWRGLYGVDYNSLSPLFEQRAALPGGWPKRFLFIGQYIKR